MYWALWDQPSTLRAGNYFSLCQIFLRDTRANLLHLLSSWAFSLLVGFQQTWISTFNHSLKFNGLQCWKSSSIARCDLAAELFYHCQVTKLFWEWMPFVAKSSNNTLLPCGFTWVRFPLWCNALLLFELRSCMMCSHVEHRTLQQNYCTSIIGYKLFSIAMG